MARRWSFLKDIVPAMVIIGAECSYVGLLTLFKAASLEGLDSYVFGVYSFAVATIVLFPISYFNTRSRIVPPPLSFSILSKIVLLGVIGGTSQMLGYAGISYSSPTLSSSIGNLIPAFTFMLAVIFRMEKISAKRSSQAKVIGSIISIAGAFVMTFYKGPSIIKAHAYLSLPLQLPISFLNSADASWTIGGILLIAQHLLASVWYILQVEILKLFPDELNVVFISTLTCTIISTAVGLFAVPNASAWKIGLNISLVSIVCSGIFGKLVIMVVVAWALRLKGPVYVTCFNPLQIVIAVSMGVIFLGDNLYFGSVVGATTISIGVYAVLWGKAAEEIEEDVANLESTTPENVPLLGSHVN